MMIVAAFPVEDVKPGRRGDIFAAILVLENLIQLVGQHACFDEGADVLAHAVVKVRVPAK